MIYFFMKCIRLEFILTLMSKWRLVCLWCHTLIRNQHQDCRYFWIIWSHIPPDAFNSYQITRSYDSRTWCLPTPSLRTRWAIRHLLEEGTDSSNIKGQISIPNYITQLKITPFTPPSNVLEPIPPLLAQPQSQMAFTQEHIDSWKRNDAYFNSFLLKEDAVLEATLKNSRDQGLDNIAVSAAQGKLLNLLAKSIQAKRIIEVGLLGGCVTATYKAIASNPFCQGLLLTLFQIFDHMACSRIAWWWQTNLIRNWSQLCQGTPISFFS